MLTRRLNKCGYLFIFFVMLFININGQVRVIFNGGVYVNISNDCNFVLDNSNVNAISVADSGNIISEGENNVLKWMIGANTGSYVVPFATSTLSKIPLKINVTNSGVGLGSFIIFSTYETATDNNISYPSDVTNMNSNCSSNNALYAVDRFWRIDAVNYTTKPTPVINFGYDDGISELGGTNTIVEAKLKAQRFNAVANSWETPQKLFGIANTTSNNVSGVAVSPADFFKSWTLIDTTIMAIPITVASTSNTCLGSTATITPSGAVNYTLLPNGITTNSLFIVTPTISTTYTVTGSVGASTAICSSYPYSFTMGVTSVPITVANANTVCAGSNATITASGASNYTLLPNGITSSSVFVVMPVASSVYTIIGSTGTGTSLCQSNPYTFTVNVNSLPITVASASNVCAGSNATISASGASNYTLLPNGITSSSVFVVLPSSSTIYTLTGSIGTGTSLCESSPYVFAVNVTSVYITVPTTSSICSGESATINPSGAVNYTLLPNGIVTNSLFIISPAITTAYSIIGEDGNNCLSTASIFTVNVNQSPNANIIQNSYFCYGTSTTASLLVSGGLAPYNYSWFNSAITPSIITTGGVVSATVTDANNCSTKQTQTIVARPQIAINPVNIIGSCLTSTTGSAEIIVSNNDTVYAVNWSNGAIGNSINNLSSGNYTVTVVDNRGCTASNVVTIPTEQCYDDIYIPQFFSPNADGENDLFVITNIQLFPNNKVDIFNRWGNLVYSKKGYDNTWDGTPNTKEATGTGLLPVSTYFIIVDFGSEKNIKKYNGFIQLEY